MSPQLRLKCAQGRDDKYIYNQVRLHGYPGGVFVGHRPPGTRVAPCKMIYKKVEVLHLFRWYTHTHLLGKVIANCVVRVHCTCKNNPVKPDMNGRGHEKWNMA